MRPPKGFMKGLISKVPSPTQAAKSLATIEDKPLAQAIKEKALKSFPPRGGAASTTGKWQMDLLKASRKPLT